jgi:hypothetical protein
VKIAEDAGISKAAEKLARNRAKTRKPRNGRELTEGGRK